MRVLDLDMDFFLTGVCELAKRGARPSLREARPWAEADVRAFLEENCGLSRQTPIPGRVFETHDGALFSLEGMAGGGQTFSAVPRHPRGRAFRPRHRQARPRLRAGNGAGPAPAGARRPFPLRARRKAGRGQLPALRPRPALCFLAGKRAQPPFARGLPRPPRRGRQSAAHGHPPFLHACPPAAAVRLLPSRSFPMRPTTTFVLSAPPPPTTSPASPSPRATRPKRRTSSPTCSGSISQRYRGSFFSPFNHAAHILTMLDKNG